MRTQFAHLVLGTLAPLAMAMPQPEARHIRARNDSAPAGPAVLPQDDPNPKDRANGVAARDEGFVYGPSLIGEAAPFPNGTLGNAWHERDMDLWSVDREEIDSRLEKDAVALQEGLTSNGPWTDMESYGSLLYDDQWKESNPRGTAPGIMTNYTQDLLFSMERLSQNPFSLVHVGTDEALPFVVDEDVAKSLSGVSLEELKASGNLYFVDYSWQEALDKSTTDPPKFGASCSAYFFIHPSDGDFLPLAIKTNFGSDLVYTPKDEPNDWLLAKMMFNVNDMFHGQMLHLVITHNVQEGVHQAALHTLGDNHPIMVLLDRMMLQGYSARIVGEWLCFNPGGHWDQLMHISNVGCRDFVTEEWPKAGRYQAGYLQNDLQARGLVNEKGEHAFKEFPYFKDASRIREGYTAFFSSFVDSYYATDDDVATDFEVQNWFNEASGPAKVHDFPVASDDSAVTKETLVDVLTHFGFIGSVVHHSLNGGDPIGSKATLPFHLPALNAPPPTEKGVEDLMPFFPDAKQAAHYVGFIGSFNRPFYETTGRTLEDSFADDETLGRLNQDTQDAAKTFFSTMGDLSSEIRGRGFDEEGLSLGMPFVYRTLDPGYIPFFCAV